MPRKRKKNAVALEVPQRKDLPVFLAGADAGLTDDQVAERLAAGWDNRPVTPPRKTAGQIIKENVFTYFNMIFFLLALCVIAVGQWLNLTFMGVVFCNTIIGTVQEVIQSKVDVSLTALVRPAVDLDRITSVMVITSFTGQGETMDALDDASSGE